MNKLILRKEEGVFIPHDITSRMLFEKLKDGCVYACSIIGGKKREVYQNKWLWSLNTDLSNQVTIEGKKFSPESWHELLKRQFLPETCEKGVDKWDYLPNGDRFLRMSSTDLNIKEFRDYSDEIEAFAVTEFNVRITDRSRRWENE